MATGATIPKILRLSWAAKNKYGKSNKSNTRTGDTRIMGWFIRPHGASLSEKEIKKEGDKLNKEIEETKTKSQKEIEEILKKYRNQGN